MGVVRVTKGRYPPSNPQGALNTENPTPILDLVDHEITQERPFYSRDQARSPSISSRSLPLHRAFIQS